MESVGNYEIYAGVVIFYLSLLLHDPMYQMLALILDLVLLMAVYVFTYPKYNANQVMPAFFAIVYVGVMLSYVYQTRMLDGGKFHVWLIFLCSCTAIRVHTVSAYSLENIKWRRF